MKKLFLYLIFYVVLFVAAYNVSFDFAKQDMEGKSIHGTTSEDSSEAGGDVEAGNEHEAEGEQAELLNHAATNQDKSDEQDVLVSHAASDKYIVGLKNNYVIVYKNDKSMVYEYTDIDGSVIKANDNEAYKMLLRSIEFDNTDEMFTFLESLSS
ncbi:MAG: hypothetical protein NC393_03470 [Clostridium sp.]|nr:hypothetical protein [Clostridium sp.]MCM1171168.1 hypothetical protein [Clostridium sp.]MCM1208508.1 hypothetical protein [Ruminococcus sp.]